MPTLPALVMTNLLLPEVEAVKRSPVLLLLTTSDGKPALVEPEIDIIGKVAVWALRSIEAKGAVAPMPRVPMLVSDMRAVPLAVPLVLVCHWKPSLLPSTPNTIFL